MSIVKGENIFIKFVNNDELQLFACARSLTINQTADFVGKSTIGSGKWKEKEIVALDWNFTLEGIVYLDEAGQITAPEIYQFWFGTDPVTVHFFVEDESGNGIQMSGDVLITNISTNGSVNNVSSVNITGEGTGQLYSSTSLYIISVEENTPSPGLMTITFGHDLLPGSTAYTIRIRDITADTVGTNTAGDPPHPVPSLDMTHEYAFALEPQPDGNGFGPEIFYP